MSSKMASTPSSSSSSSTASGSAGSPHLCLRWNNYQSNLTSVFDQLLQNETFVDVTLAADGHAIKAHRMVLSACSPYFQHLFFDNPCQHPIVILKDTRWPELKAIVEYMYRGEISVAQEELTSLLRVAETLKIRGLSELNSDRHAAAAAADDARSDASPIHHPANLVATTSSSRRMADSPTWPTHPVQAAWPHHHVAEEESATTPSPAPAAPSLRSSSGVKRRRMSGPDSPAGATSPAAASTPGMHHQHHEEASLDHHDGPLSLVGHQAPLPPPPPPQSPVASASLAPQALTQAPPPSLHPMVHADDLDIKPGIAELIREEERARMLEGTHPWLTASPSVLSESLVQWRSKAPSWSKETLQEAINSIVTQKMRFTQASSHYNIPKGTLYDNILGKSKRMLVLDELGLDAQDEEAVLDFCCETSVMPYNRRTNKSLESIVAFVEKLKQSKGHPSFKLGNLMGFRWWWAFCKKHNIVSLFYVKNNNNNKSSKNKNNNNNRSSPSSASSASSGSSNNNNLSPSPPDELIPENLSKPFEEELPGMSVAAAAAAAAAASAFRSINNNNIHLSQAFQLSHAFLLQQQQQQQQQRQNHRHNLRSRTHSVDHDQGDDSDPEPENLSVHRDTYQYQLQALWQKAWATGQGVMQNLRFRERGPFKTWRPETMAEAIMAVLREGLSLSQAARKFDIPYPTFVLYANRVNNMLGPSADGGPELRPKGRGRPQRILTGSWPEEHVHGVIRAVVFRDPSSLPRHIDREDASKLTANRSSSANSNMGRMLTVPPPQTMQGEIVGGSGSGMRGLIQSAMNNGNTHNNHEFALPSSSTMTGTYTHGNSFSSYSQPGGSLMAGGSAYPTMRSMAGPSSANNGLAANGLMADLIANSVPMGHSNGNIINNNNNNNNSINMQGASGNHVAGSSAAACLSGNALTTSSLFSALQQEVAEETRLAALNAMTQRLMTSLEGDTFGMGGAMSMNQCGQQRGPNCMQNPAAAAAAAAALEAAAWFGPNSGFSGQLPIVDLSGDDVAVVEDDEDDEDNDDDAVQHLASFGTHGNSAAVNPVPVKQEQLFGE